MQPTLEEVIDLAKQAGEILRAGFRTKIKVTYKGETDIVTEMDHRSEELLISQIQSRFPGHKIITEESGELEGKIKHCWYIDPLDGTVNYAHGVPIFCVSLAYAEEGKVVLGVIYDPSRDECFAAERGKGAWLNGEPIHVSNVKELIGALCVTGFSYDVATEKNNNLANWEYFTMHAQAARRLGSAALDLAYLAAGRVDGYWEVWIHPWDIAAGALLAEEAGAVVTDYHGSPDYFRPPFSLVAANAQLHPAMLAGLK
jgi:myo-inositol-1(or 4)-monophosphatase